MYEIRVVALHYGCALTRCNDVIDASVRLHSYSVSGPALDRAVIEIGPRGVSQHSGRVQRGSGQVADTVEPLLDHGRRRSGPSAAASAGGYRRDGVVERPPVLGRRRIGLHVASDGHGFLFGHSVDHSLHGFAALGAVARRARRSVCGIETNRVL